MSDLVINSTWNNRSMSSSVFAGQPINNEAASVSTRSKFDLRHQDYRSRDLSSFFVYLKDGVAKAALFGIVVGGSLASTPSPAVANQFVKSIVAPERASSASRKAQSRDSQRASLTEKIYLLRDASWLAPEDQAALEITVTEAATFLQLVPNSVALPRLSYSDDGEIFLSWSFEDGRRAELSFSSELGHGYALFKDGMYYPGEKELVSSEFPSDLLSYLKT